MMYECYFCVLSLICMCVCVIKFIVSVIDALFLSLLQNGQTPSHHAAWNGHSECLKLLLEAGANMGAKNSVRLHSHLFFVAAVIQR